MNNRCIGYIRVSTKAQELSPESQRGMLELWCSNSEHLLVGVYVEQVSGATPVEKRPQLLAALDALTKQDAGSLLVIRRDRLARDIVTAAVIERLVERRGAKILAADGAGNGSGAEVELLRAIVDAFAQYERALIRARTSAAMAVKRRRGECLGVPPYGWRVAPDGKLLEQDPQEQEVVARILRAREAGLTERAIVESLNAQGVPARGARWHRTTVQRVLTRAAQQ